MLSLNGRMWGCKAKQVNRVERGGSSEFVPVELAFQGSLLEAFLLQSHFWKFTLDVSILKVSKILEKSVRCLLQCFQLNPRNIFWFVLNSSYFNPLFRKHLLRQVYCFMLLAATELSLIEGGPRCAPLPTCM